MPELLLVLIPSRLDHSRRSADPAVAATAISNAIKNAPAKAICLLARVAHALSSVKEFQSWFITLVKAKAAQPQKWGNDAPHQTVFETGLHQNLHGSRARVRADASQNRLRLQWRAAGLNHVQFP